MPRENPAAEAFMKDLYSRTWANPFLPGTRGFNHEADEEGGVVCWVDVAMRPWGDGVLLESIQTHLEDYDCHEKGYATATMRELMAMADQYNVPLYGSVTPFGRPKRMNKTQLKRWYEGLGFDVDRGGRLVYQPRTASFRGAAADFAPVRTVEELLTALNVFGDRVDQPGLAPAEVDAIEDALFAAVLAGGRVCDLFAEVEQLRAQKAGEGCTEDDKLVEELLGNAIDLM